MSKSFKNPNFYIDSSGIIMDNDGTTLKDYTHIKTFQSVVELGLQKNTNYDIASIFGAMPDNSQLLIGNGTSYISGIPNTQRTYLFQKIDGKESIVSYSQEDNNTSGIGYWHKKPNGTSYWDNVVMSNNMSQYLYVDSIAINNYKIAATKTTNFTVTMTTANRKVLGCIGYKFNNATINGTSGAGCSLINIYKMIPSDNSIEIYIRNLSTTAEARVTGSIFLLSARQL